MTANPVELIGGITTNADVPKADIVSWAKARVPQVLANNDEIRSTNLALQQVVFVKSPGISWYLDAADSTTADDDITCVISLDEKRFKPLSSIPAPTPASLGGVFSLAPVANHFLTGIDTDGTPLHAQPSAANLSDGVTGTDEVVLSTSPHIVTPTGIVKADVGLSNVDNTSDATKWAAVATLTNKVINAVSNTISNLATSMFAANVVDTDTTLAANSDTRLATQKAVKAYVDALLNANDAMQFRGVIDCSANPNYPAANAGYVYRVSVAGKIGGASGVNVEAGDQLLCITDSSASGNQATVGANWSITQSNIDGAVVGPASAVSGNIPTFNGTTGKLIQDGGKALPSGAIVGTSDSQTLTSKTLTSPAINTPTIAGGTHDGLTSLGIRSTGAAFDIKLANGEVLTAPRTLNYILGNADRTLTLGGNATLNGGTHSGTNTGDQTITLTGDVTGTGTGSFATTIGANKVTLGMMAQIATATFLGRASASTGNVEALTAAQATALLNAVVGDTGSGGTKGLAPAPGAGDAAGGKYLKADGTWAVPPGTGGGGTLSNEDRQNILLGRANMSKALVGYQRFINAFADGYKASDGINAGSSSNYSVNTTAGYVAPTSGSGTTVTAGTASGAQSFGSFTYLDRGTSVVNSQTIYSIGIYTSAARTFTLKVAQRNSAGNYTIVVTQAVSHPGGGFVDFVLNSPYVVPGSGTYYIGAATNASSEGTPTSAARGFIAGDATGTSAGWTEDTQSVPPMRYTYGVTPNNMTVVTTSQTADASVSNGRVLLEIDNTATPTLNTDLTVEVTCNGGTNWTAATLSSVSVNGQGGRKIVETADTACTAGTSFAARIKTFNNKNIPIHKTSLTVH